MKKTSAKAQLRTLVNDRLAGKSSAFSICLFLGAGADIGAGGLTFNQLKGQWFAEASGSVTFAYAEEDIDEFFQKDFANIPVETRGPLIRAIFNKATDSEPSDAYKILALTIRSGGIDAILTTNFDTMLEKAADLVGGRSFDVYAPGTAKPFRTAQGDFSYVGCPYVKLHGDLRSGHITVLTQEEIDNGNYDKDILALVKKILSSHVLILSGYSGWDKALAQVIGKAVAQGKQKVFWCNPSPPNRDSPLWQALPSGSVQYIEATFLETVKILAQSRFERPFEIHSSTSTFIEPLFEWRVEHARRAFIKEYASYKEKALTPFLIRRDKAEAALNAFLCSSSEKNLAVVVGASGMGKSVLGIRLAHTHPDQHVLLLKGKNIQPEMDFERLVLSYAGTTSLETVSLFAFVNWLAKQGQRIVVFLDALNEMSTTQEICLNYLKNIVKMCYILNGHSALRIVITIRHELWGDLLHDIDEYLLLHVLWSEDNKNNEIKPISLKQFTDKELNSALKVFINNELLPSSSVTLPIENRELLREPYLFGLLVKEGRRGHNSHYDTSIEMLRSLYRQKTEAIAGNHASDKLQKILTSLTVKCTLDKKNDFRTEDLRILLEENGNSEVLQGRTLQRFCNDMVENGLLCLGSKGLYSFAHDTVFQFFLAQAFIGDYGLPPLETLEDLTYFITNFGNNDKAMAAARFFLLENLWQHIQLIKEAQQSLDKDSISSLSKKLFVFSKELLLDATHEYIELKVTFGESDKHLTIFAQNKEILIEYCSSVISNSRGSMQEFMSLKTALQIIAAMDSSTAVPLLAKALENTNRECAVEAQIYIIDRLSRELLMSQDIQNILTDERTASYFGGAAIPAWKKLGRLAILSSAFGTDNIHPSEYNKTIPLLVQAFTDLAHTISICDNDIDNILEKVTSNLDRYLFNAQKEDVLNFFNNKDRKIFIDLTNKLENGKCLESHDLEQIQKYTLSITYPLEFNLNNLLFCLSALNDFNATIEAWQKRVDTFNNESPPEEVDFYAGVIKFIFLTSGRYELHRMETFISRILSTMPKIIYYLPGLWRGSQRGFSDLFDRIFEDGFNPISAYFNVKLGMIRRNMDLKQFSESNIMEDKNLESIAPVYAQPLSNSIAKKDSYTAVVILQGFGNGITAIPEVGLAALRNLTSIREQDIRRAVLRLLKEAYARHPIQTSKFLELVRETLSNEELRLIKSAADPCLGKRKLSGAEWARIFRFFICEIPHGRTAIFRCLRILYEANSAHEAVRDIADFLGVYAIQRK